MVTVYRPYFESGYEWTMPVDNSRPILDLRYRQRGAPWHPLWMYLLHFEEPEDGGAPLRDADMPWHGSSVLVLKRHARKVLEPWLAADAEILACECDGADELSLAHPWRVVDALDVENSHVRRFTDGRVMGVTKFSFCEEMVTGLNCFRLPQLPRLFVTDSIVVAVKDAGLHGTIFRPVWRSE
jgi:hypothetical protein